MSKHGVLEVVVAVLIHTLVQQVVGAHLWKATYLLLPGKF
jgi:hypothetical protein